MELRLTKPERCAAAEQFLSRKQTTPVADQSITTLEVKHAKISTLWSERSTYV